MKQFYKEWNPKPATMELIETADQIIRAFSNQGYTLTIRQLYYQFVGKALIENSEKSYNNLVAAMTRARMAGMISWEAIEDRNRTHNTYWSEESGAALVARLHRAIRFDQWARQPCYVEVWVEKEALGNVVARACDPYLVPHMACKGYLSASEAWRAGQRFEERLDAGKRCVLIHLGDHDPSGIDMTRDNDERLDLFTMYREDQDTGVEVRRIALNMDQIEEHRPPPNPAKVTDSRAKEYISRFGGRSWELDALRPQVIEELITKEVAGLIDHEAWEDTEALQEAERGRLIALDKHWERVCGELAKWESE